MRLSRLQIDRQTDKILNNILYIAIALMTATYCARGRSWSMKMASRLQIQASTCRKLLMRIRR